jgi:aldehyde:ferredoxin oxidoreductase
MNGYVGTILQVDLCSGKEERMAPDEILMRRFLGGRGFVSEWLYEHLPRGVPPLSDDNLLIFASGPCNGTIVPSSCRGSVGAKSPLTSLLGSGNTGSSFSVQLKRAGYDMVVLRGKARCPSYLIIEDGDVRLVNCEDLWGIGTAETVSTLRRRHGYRGVSIACIGQAGEQLVPISTIVFDRFRGAGRGGMGAVMGSKNLKAIVVKGSGGVRAAHVGRLRKAALDFIAALKREPYFERYSKDGTAVIVEAMNRQGSVLVRNGTEGFFQDIEGINAKRLKTEVSVRQKACFSCPMSCTQQYGVSDGRYAGAYGEGSSGASVVMGFGPRCGVSDIRAIAKAHSLTNELGLDLISTNAVIAFGMECVEKGLITADAKGGTTLRFGDADALIHMITDIAFKRGFGTVLGQGVKKASEIIGGESEWFAPHVKGMDMMEVDPRGMPGWGLMFAVSSRGADHVRAYDVSQMMPFSDDELIRIAGTPKVRDMFGPEGKGRSVAFFENIRAVADSMEICRFVTRGKLGFPERLVDLLCHVTGMTFSPEELYSIGERIINIERLFNLGEGMTPADDTLPRRYLYEPLQEGGARNQTVPLKEMLSEYYAARGWDTITGYPTAETRTKLQI